MKKNITYILASGSPRRIEMMHAHGYDPIICPADIDENIPLHHGMKETVMFLALKKARAAEAKLLSGQCEDESSLSEGKLPCDGKAASMQTPSESPSASIIIAADTIVYKDEIMGKPKDKNDARRILMSLSGDTHYVVTGCALLEAGKEHASVFAEITKVYVNDVSAEEIEAYISTDEPYDKAGGYAIQGAFGKYIDHIEGDYDNVVGFPWSRIETELSKFISQISD